jgi:hypothetical protein
MKEQLSVIQIGSETLLEKYHLMQKNIDISYDEITQADFDLFLQITGLPR